MNRMKGFAASGLALVLTLGAPIAWAQTAPNDGAATAPQTYQAISYANESTLTMDHQVSREIRQAWSQGKNATAAMAYQEHAEIALSNGNDLTAVQYLQAAEQELQTLQPEQNKY